MPLRRALPAVKIDDSHILFYSISERNVIHLYRQFVHTLSPYDDALSLWIEMRITSLSIVGFSMPIPLTPLLVQKSEPNQAVGSSLSVPLFCQPLKVHSPGMAHIDPRFSNQLDPD